MMRIFSHKFIQTKMLVSSILLACSLIAHGVERDEYSDADYAADNNNAYEYTNEDYAADQYDESEYAADNFVAYANDEDQKESKETDAQEDEDSDELDEEDDEEGDDEEEEEAGDFESLIIPEATLAYDREGEEASPTELSMNIYAYYQMMVTDDLEFLLEGEVNTQSAGSDDHLALQKPELTISTLGFNFYTDFGGVGFGKFDFLRDEGLFDAIWARQLYGRSSLPAADLDLSDVIGVRAWLDLEDVLPGSHSLYLGAFFRDNTFLNDAYLSRSGNSDERITGLGYTRRLNNWVISLQGGDFETLPGWEYVVGATMLTNNSQDDLVSDDEDDEADDLAIVNREISLFTGLYGEFEVTNELEVNPLIEILYRDGADGFDQNVLSFATGVALNQGNWTYGGYYSNRRTHDKLEEEYLYDSQLQAFISYTFDSGVYLDIEHQRNIFDSDRSNATFVSLGIPITFSSEGNIYGRRSTKSTDEPKSNVRRFIRRR